MALRLGLGASTRHLVRQFVAEGLVLATAGTIAGIGLAVAMLDAVVALAPDGIARMASASIDGGSLLFAAACLVMLTLGIGCIPLLLVRAPSIDTLLRRSAAGTGGSTRAARVGGALVAVEVMGTVALLVIACALAVSFANLRGANVGFDRDGVLTASVNPSRVRYPDAAARRRFFRDVMARLEANPEVEAAGAALLRPLEGVIGWDLPYALPGQGPGDAAGNSILNLEVVTPAWFDAIGTPLLAGRAFAETDGLRVAGAGPDPAVQPADGSAAGPQPTAVESTAGPQPAAPVEATVERRPLVAIVSESVAREMYGSPLEAVGRRFVGGRNAPRSYRIVGVVADGRYRRVHEVSRDVFLPYTQTSIPLRYVVVRTSASPAAARAMLRRALRRGGSGTADERRPHDDGARRAGAVARAIPECAAAPVRARVRPAGGNRRVRHGERCREPPAARARASPSPRRDPNPSGVVAAPLDPGVRAGRPGRWRVGGRHGGPHVEPDPVRDRPRRTRGSSPPSAA